MPSLKTKSIRLTEEEARELQDFVARTGAVEATALKHAALRGLREERLDHAVLEYLRQRNSSQAAAVANLSRAEFLNVLVQRGITLLDEPSTLATELENLAEDFGNERLARAAR